MADSVVIKEDRNPAGGDEYGHTVADDQSTGMIDLKPPAPVEFDGEHLKRCSFPKSL